MSGKPHLHHQHSVPENTKHGSHKKRNSHDKNKNVNHGNNSSHSHKTSPDDFQNSQNN